MGTMRVEEFVSIVSITQMVLTARDVSQDTIGLQTSPRQIVMLVKVLPETNSHINNNYYN